MSLASRAVTAAVLAAMVAVAGYIGLAPLAAAASLLAVLIAVGWPTLIDVPDRAASTTVILTTGVGAVAAVYWTGDRPDLRIMGVILAAAILLSFISEFLRRGGRKRLVESLAGNVSGALVAVSAAGWVACGRSPEGEALVVAAAVALALASSLSALPLKRWLSPLVVVAGAAAGGAVLGFVLQTIGLFEATVAGTAVGVLVVVVKLLLQPIPALDRRLPALTAVVLPVVLGGMLTYISSRVLLG